MSKVGNERLTILANALREWHEQDKPFSTLTWTKCAMNVAANTPELAAQGLSIAIVRPNNDFFTRVPMPCYRDAHHHIGTYYGWEAVQRFFDISEWTARCLFGNWNTNDADTALACAMRIYDYLISEHAKELA